MKMIKNITLSLIAIISFSVFSSIAMAQTVGNSAPINFNQILSGNGTSSSSSSSSSVRPYTQSGGADYNLSMEPTTVMRNRARRDAMAQAQSRVANDYMQQSYLDQEYQNAFAKYQEQFRKEGTGSGSSKRKVSTRNVKVDYNAQKQKKLFVTPQRVFRGY